MTVQEVIDFTDRVKPNDFTEEDKTKWISNVEGMVQAQIFLQAPAEFITCLLYTSDAADE